VGRLLLVNVGSGSGKDGAGSDGAGDEVGAGDGVGAGDEVPPGAEPVSVGVAVIGAAPAARCAERDAAVGPPRPAGARDPASRLDPPAAGAAVPAGWTSTTSGDAPAALPPPASVVLAGPPGRIASDRGDAPKATAARAPPTTTGAATRVALYERR
jgi:hypothetical protein